MGKNLLKVFRAVTLILLITGFLLMSIIHNGLFMGELVTCSAIISFAVVLRVIKSEEIKGKKYDMHVVYQKERKEK